MKEGRGWLHHGCFAIYDDVLPYPSRCITCIKCKSLTHTHCAAAVAPPHAPTSGPCARTLPPHVLTLIISSLIRDRPCATKIAAVLMRKAVEVVRENAGKKAEEAARARKRAREALDHLVWVANEEKIRKLNEEERMRNVKEEEEEEDEDFAKDLEILLIKEGKSPIELNRKRIMSS